MSALNKDLLFIKKQLIRVGYPEIIDQDVNYIKSLLSKEDRLHFLAWICKTVINDDIDMNSPNVMQTIQEEFYTHGFCTQKDLEVTFLNLEINELQPCVKRALSWIIKNQNTNESIEASQEVDIEDVERMARKLSVLPPEMKPKLISEDEQSQLRSELENQIQKTKQEILRLQSMRVEECPSTVESISNVSLEDIDGKLSGFGDFVKKVEHILSLDTMRSSDVESTQNSDIIKETGALIQRSAENTDQLLKVCLFSWNPRAKNLQLKPNRGIFVCFQIYSVKDYLSQQARQPEKTVFESSPDEMAKLMDNILKS